jgi:two-component system response regulator WspF
MRIAIVNDMPMAVEILRRIFLTTPQHQVAWTARDGAEAVEKCAQDIPDLILMDLLMPVMDGVEATRRIMAKTPCAILVVTAAMDGNSEKVFEALGAGALDVTGTPVLGAAGAAGAAPLLIKIEMLGKQIEELNREKTPPIPPSTAKPAASRQNRLVAIGASAGGPMALTEILKALPADFPAAIVIVQHVDSQFAPGLVEWLNLHSPMPVQLAHEGAKPAEGTVLVAGTGDHLVFTTGHSLGYTPNPVNYVYRPSVDVFFQSIIKHWPGEAVGVLLTGMGRDGAAGLKMMRDAGHHTIAQDRLSSAVYGMPKAAASLGAAIEILPLDQIGLALKKKFFASLARQPL